ncbi:SLOG family protein [Sphingopyxis sp. 550A]
MTDDADHPDSDACFESCASAHLLEEIQLYGYRPFEDEPDGRPLPDDRLASGAVADIFDALAGCLVDTRIEPDLEDLLWGVVNLFHSAGNRIERELDRNEAAQRELQRSQDGSEIHSVELERAIAEGISMIERRDAMEFFRECAAEQYRIYARKAWVPRTGSRVRHQTMTAAMIDSRDFLDRRLREKAKALIPEGTRIAFSGGPSCNDHQHIWSALDRVHARHTDMVLLHGATPTGAERAAACWADARKVPQVAFRPDWTRDRKAAPFKRNERMIDAMPAGLIVFSGTGIQDNLVDKARAFGIPVWDFRIREAP